MDAWLATVAVNVLSSVAGSVCAVLVGQMLERRRIAWRVPELTHPRGMR